MLPLRKPGSNKPVMRRGGLNSNPIVCLPRAKCQTTFRPMSFALTLCLLAQTPVVEENFDEAILRTHTFIRLGDSYTTTCLRFRRGKLLFLADANVEEGEYAWTAEPRGLTVRYYDTQHECVRVIHVQTLREYVLDHEERGGIVHQPMKKP